MRKFVFAMLSAFAAFAASAEVEVYLLVGQSNMAGRGRMSEVTDAPIDGIRKMDVFGNLRPAVEPIHYDKPSAGAGLGVPFAQALRRKDATRQIVLVPCAFGGSRLDEWKRGSYMYDHALLRARHALKALGGKGRLAGILWHQGESDSGREDVAKSYCERFCRTMTDLRRDLGCGDVPLVVGELGHYLAEYSAKHNGGCKHFETVNAELHKAAATLPNCACVSSEGLTSNPDLLHFNSRSLRAFGERYADAMETLRAGR